MGWVNSHLQLADKKRKLYSIVYIDYTQFKNEPFKFFNFKLIDFYIIVVVYRSLLQYIEVYRSLYSLFESGGYSSQWCITCLCIIYVKSACVSAYLCMSYVRSVCFKVTNFLKSIVESNTCRIGLFLQSITI